MRSGLIKTRGGKDHEVNQPRMECYRGSAYDRNGIGSTLGRKEVNGSLGKGTAAVGGRYSG